ncbi:MAG TPA: DUF4336 domain-containing protein [Solirubrobacterales bacterium]|nr:DUF4336 domain-containing protein [Solirubrobacterales bacterium]
MASKMAPDLGETTIRELVPELWVVETPLRFLGVEVGRRMTIARLRAGGLWIHSPARLTDGVRTSLEAIGEPRFVVAASAIHGHVFMEQYRTAYGEVDLFAAPGLDRRRKDLAFDGMLGSTPDPRWADDIDQALFLGHLIPEVLFLHRASGTLIVGDLVVNERRQTAPFATRFAWRLEGAFGSPGVPRTLRLTTRNRKAARRAVEQVLEWEFDRIIVGHGEIIENGGKSAFAEAMSWLLA